MSDERVMNNKGCPVFVIKKKKCKVKKRNIPGFIHLLGIRVSKI